MTLELLKKEIQGERWTFLLIIGVSGLSNAAVLAIINFAASDADASHHAKPFLMFLVAILLFVLTLRYVHKKSSEVFETMIHRIRSRLAAKISRSELSVMEGLGRGTIYNRLIQDTETLARSRQTLVTALQSVILVFFVCLYIAYLSLPAFVLTVVMTGTAIGIYIVREREATRLISETSEADVQLLTRFTELLDGFKQIKMREGLSHDLLEDIHQLSTRVRRLRVDTAQINNNNNIFAQSFFYLLMGAVVFVLPRYVHTYSEVLSEVTAAILFIVGPLSLVVAGIPVLGRTDAAALNLQALENQLDRHHSVVTERATPHAPSDLAGFNEIEVSDVTFAYPSATGGQGFSVGPLSLTLEPGRIIFITGGNGSGKSTFMKVLTGLYPASSGSITIDDMPLTEASLQEYRELFSVIFGDFLLFKKLYGLKGTAPELVNQELKQLRIFNKTQFDGETFSHLDLSTGQRKRVALAVAKLENRPIMVLDEWAADQDPEFRDHFYTHILPALKAAGKTVVAVTHDDKYHGLADQLVKMDYGRIADPEPTLNSLATDDSGAQQGAP